MVKNTNKKSRERLKKVISVLYPEYKHITVKKNLNVVLSRKAGWLARLFSSKDRISYGLLILHYLPKKLSLLKYNNLDFLSTVIEGVTSTEIRKGDVTSYFYEEIVKVKYPHIFKELSVSTERIPCSESEDECESSPIDFQTRRTMEKINRKAKHTFLMSLQEHPLYYEIMVIFAVSVMLLSVVIFFHK
jgi:hypothetical protein